MTGTSYATSHEPSQCPMRAASLPCPHWRPFSSLQSYPSASQRNCHTATDPKMAANRSSTAIGPIAESKPRPRQVIASNPSIAQSLFECWILTPNRASQHGREWAPEFDSRLQYHGEEMNAEDRVQMSIASKSLLWWDPNRPNQTNLWGSWIELSPEFFLSISSAPVPLHIRALKALTN